MRFPVRLVGLVGVVLASSTLACTTVPVGPSQAGGPVSPRPCSPKPATDVDYATVEGVDPDLLSLDVYPSPNACRTTSTPVVVWVHGGGWATGDKANLGAKVQWAADRGWVLVSVNYRLSPSPYSDDPERVVHPTHVQDLADALQWVSAHIDEYGGDAGQVALMGHSAGAHLVSLVSVDERYLAEAGAPADLIDCTVALDTEGYDLNAKLAGGDLTVAMTHNAFGDDPAAIRDASPMLQIESGERLPRVLIVTRGADARQAVAREFASTLSAAGGSAEMLVASGYSHAAVNRRFGEPGESTVTPAVDEFLTGCFAAS